MKIKILDRYLLSELFIPFLLGIVGFVLIMTVDLLFTFVDMIINKGIPFAAVFKLLMFKLPAIMVLTYPVSFLFAVAVVFGRMSRDSELAAMRTSGTNFFRICAPVIVASVLISGLAFITNEFMVPWANRVSEDIIRQVIMKQPLPDVKEKVFFKDNFNRFFYVDKVDGKTNTMQNVMIYELTEKNFPRVITAKSAVWKGDTWDLTDGAIQSFDGSGHMDYESDFSSMRIVVTEDILNFTQPKTPAEMNTAELGSQIDFLKKGGAVTQQLATEFQMKFSIPLTTLVFALIAIPLSLPSPRGGRAFGFALSVVIVFSFYVFASVFRSMGRGGMLAPFLAAWIPPAAVALLGTGLIIKEGAVR